MFKTYMHYCEAYCQKCSLKVRLSINCHKKCDTRLWQIYRRWWLTQDIIWCGIFHFRSINYLRENLWAVIKFVGYLCSWCLREQFWVVINVLGTIVHDIWESNFEWWCLAGVWGTTEVKICCPLLFLRLGEQSTLLLRKLHISCNL